MLIPHGVLLGCLIVLVAGTWAAFRRVQAAERRTIRLEGKVLELTATRARLEGQIDALTTALTMTTTHDDVVRETSVGIKDAVLAVLNPYGPSTGPSTDPDMTATFMPWGDDSPIELDDDGIVLLEGAVPGTPDDWDGYDPQVMGGVIGSRPDAVAEEL
jgi:hypothetical protein